MKNKILCGIMTIAVVAIAIINVKDGSGNIESLWNMSVADIEGLADSQEADVVSCSVSINCYNAYGRLIKTVECSSSTGDCTSGTEGILQTEWIKCEGKKYTCG